MTLTLLAVSLNDRPLSQPITAHFGPEGGTIGRADHNTMALPDPERHISRLQAEIIASGPQFQIRNVGAANPISVAGRPVAAGESVPLRHGHEVRIGGYQLKVIDDASADRTGGDVTRGRAAVMAQAARAAQDALGGNADPIASGSPFSTSAGFGSVPPRPGPRSGGGIGPLPEASGSPLSDNNPFADLLGPSPTAATVKTSSSKSVAIDPFADLMPAPAGVSAGSPASAPPAAAPARLPDDFDPMAMPPKVSPPWGPAVAASSDDPFAGLLPSAAPSSSIDQLFGLGAGSGADPLAAFMAGAAPASGGDGQASPGLSTDPLALFGAPAAAPTAATAPDQVPPLQEAFSPPRPVKAAPAEPPALPPPAPMPPPAPVAARPVPAAPVPVPEPAPLPNSLFGSLFAKTGELRRDERPAPAPVAPASDHPATAPLPRRSEAVSASPPPPAAAAAAQAGGAAGQDREALWAAFCAGAGVPIDLPGGITPEMMNILGQIMINALGGTLRLMAVRANVKQEMRAHMTVIQARSNNPLKFSPDARSGLEQLLKPPMRGFLAGPEAMTDAMHDLVGHSIGTVVGMRAALEGVLERFEPDALESKLTSKSLLDTVLPMNRKARLWELYLQHFETIRNEAQDDFQALFGKAFLAAYEQQLDRLHQEAGGAR